jgi:uncharacterized lipoprotein YddW (UPF0748 family)/uncharacterized protein YjdB
VKKYDVLKRVLAIVLLFAMVAGSINIEKKEAEAADTTVRAVWLSYIEVQDLLQDKSQAAFTSAFTKICDNLLSNNCNTIYFHVRANADATYPSSYFPWSTTVSSSGNALSYDPLSIMVSVAKSKGIKFYAWINPYRISASSDKTAKLLAGTYSPSSYQAKFNEWYKKGIITRQTYNGNDCLFFEPGNADARALIVNGVKEIVQKYAVDGVIMDDYFYVWWTSNDEANPASAISARKANVNALVKEIYSTIKSVNSSIKFGISPEGNLDNARRQGCDLETWLSSSGYIDFIAPQIYWTDNYGSSGTTKMFSDRLSSWVSLVKNGTPVYPALALYRAGTSLDYDKGWSKSTSNLKQQWSTASGKGCTGYSLFSYTYMLTDAGKKEMNNLNGKSSSPLDATDSPLSAYVYDTASVKYQTHVQDFGWQTLVSDGSISGTTGYGKRLESIDVSVESEYSGDITYRTHIQDKGWSSWVSNGASSGTTGLGKRLEAIEIKLTGELAENYDVYYRVHAQDYGWLGWAKNGETSGTTGKAKRLEAIQIVLVKKGGSAPGTTKTPCVESLIEYRTHVQSYGWQSYVSDGAISGTTGRGMRLEAIQIKLANQKYSGGVIYKVHCQGNGWMNWVTNGSFAGTTGEAKRLEAIQIELTGEMANHYDIEYRVHCQGNGWMNWVKNGEIAGTYGESKRLEAIQIRLVEKN